DEQAVGGPHLCEADRALAPAALGVDRLRWITRRAALSVRRRRDPRRRRVLRVAGQEAVTPGVAPVGRAVVTGPHVTVHDLGAIVVRAGDNDVRMAWVDGNCRLVL